MLSINDILPNNEEEFYRTLMDTVAANIRVAMPGIIQAFDPVEQVVSVQPAIRERIRNPDLSYSWVKLPLLLDVPIVFPRAGGFSLTMPVQQGDECLIVFGDMCMDGWWSSGGVQNQPDKRRHDLSDGYAILGVWSQPRVISNYATDAAQLRTDDGQTYISLKPGEIDLVATTVKVNGTVIST
ncbi:hypothetical protein Alches_16320 [Alicyclobacillus hesperidum subsp. aegles]|uniref:Gp138 family membrane-puncturing spike protein n=1 Tax=Alicyclobacillus hesperidum TaxID=89784 RepID=UPI00222DF542|nr:Gp138 family membrane-puncturing spike protein [Alicyclobacillus hesperidum]GLG01592.1 hypothetical protein Alches_16320 [Alicyclobacillus hesperidum subsp. aegles]